MRLWWGWPAWLRCCKCGQLEPWDEIYMVNDDGNGEWVCHPCVEAGDAWACPHDDCRRGFTRKDAFEDHMDDAHWMDKEVPNEVSRNH